MGREVEGVLVGLVGEGREECADADGGNGCVGSDGDCEGRRGE